MFTNVYVHNPLVLHITTTLVLFVQMNRSVTVQPISRYRGFQSSISPAVLGGRLKLAYVKAVKSAHYRVSNKNICQLIIRSVLSVHIVLCDWLNILHCDAV